MKQTLKDLLPAIILSITISFMFFIFEPITMYATNPDDFWFDIYNIMPVLVPSWFVFSLYVFTPLLLCYIVFKGFLKKPGIYYVITSAVFCIFLITYIQGNFLAGSLPGISGDPFNWREYKAETITSIALWAIVFVALLISLIKFKPAKIFSVIPFVATTVLIMLGVSLTSTIFTTDALENKSVSIATYENFNLASNNQNLFVLLVDAVDAKEFNDLLKNNKEYQELFKDFCFYEDVMSYYPYTRDSIPFIFNPTPNHNEMPFADFAKKILSESEVFKSLKKDKFNMNFFYPSNIMSEETAKDFQNMVDKAEIEPKVFLKQIIRYDLFKYLPYPLKGKPHIENLDFASTKKEEEYEGYSWSNIQNYNKLQSNQLEITDDKVFNFTYTEGGHVPFNMDENLNYISGNTGNYYQKITATFKIIKTYIERLKDAGVYDNSAIVIMADHGYEVAETTVLKRFNPILYIKGINETHNKMMQSDKPISSSDLSTMLIDLSQGKNNSEIFQDINAPRKRTMMRYVFTYEYHMEEYESDGKAREDDKMTPTGNVYDLEQ